VVPLFTSTTLFSDLGFSFFLRKKFLREGKKSAKERRKIPSELIKKE